MATSASPALVGTLILFGLLSSACEKQEPLSQHAPLARSSAAPALLVDAMAHDAGVAAYLDNEARFPREYDAWWANLSASERAAEERVMQQAEQQSRPLEIRSHTPAELKAMFNQGTVLYNQMKDNFPAFATLDDDAKSNLLTQVEARIGVSAGQH